MRPSADLRVAYCEEMANRLLIVLFAAGRRPPTGWVTEISGITPG
jgi:hypothetical protein